MPLASRTASASSSNGIAASTGPNTSSHARRCVDGHVAQQRRRDVEAAAPARRPRRGLARRSRMPSRAASARKPSTRARCDCADQRPAIAIGERGCRDAAPRSARRAARAAARTATRSTSRREPALHVWPAFCTIALTSAGSAASRSASANTICGDLPPSSSVTGQWRAAAAAATARARRRRAGEREVRDARMRGQRGARFAAEAGDDVERAVRQAGVARELGERAAATGTRPRPA